MGLESSFAHVQTFDCMAWTSSPSLLSFLAMGFMLQKDTCLALTWHDGQGPFSLPHWLSARLEIPYLGLICSLQFQHSKFLSKFHQEHEVTHSDIMTCLHLDWHKLRLIPPNWWNKNACEFDWREDIRPLCRHWCSSRRPFRRVNMRVGGFPYKTASAFDPVKINVASGYRISMSCWIFPFHCELLRNGREQAPMYRSRPREPTCLSSFRWYPASRLVRLELGLHTILVDRLAINQDPCLKSFQLHESYLESGSSLSISATILLCKLQLGYTIGMLYIEH